MKLSISKLTCAHISSVIVVCLPHHGKGLIGRCFLGRWTDGIIRIFGSRIIRIFSSRIIRIFSSSVNGTWWVHKMPTKSHTTLVKRAHLCAIIICFTSFYTYRTIKKIVCNKSEDRTIIFDACLRNMVREL